MEGRHKLLRKPWVSLIIYPIFAVVVFVGVIGVGLSLLMPDIPVQEYTSVNLAASLGFLAGGIIALLVHRIIFRKDFVFGSWLRHMPKGFLLGLPLLVPVVLNLTGIDYASLSRGFVIAAFLESLAPAVYEEVCFRVLPVSTAIWSMRDEKKILLIFVLPSAIFALFHIGAGGSLLGAALSVLFGLGLGLMNEMIYLRSGTFIPAMIYHLLINFTGNLQAAGVTGTTAASISSVVITILICVMFIVFAFIFVRPSVRPQIMNIWSHKYRDYERA